MAEKHRATSYERYLMDLLQFENLGDLQKFMNGPSHQGFLAQSQVPEESYDLLEKDRQAEEVQESLELLYGMSQPYV